MKAAMRSFAIIGLSMAPSLAAAQTGESSQSASVKPPPAVDVWFEQDSYLTFDKAKVFFNAEPGAYVVVLRVTPRGTLEILYPSSPNAQAPYRLRADARTALRFRNDGIEGVGEVSAISSAAPFDFSRVADGAKWNGHRLLHPRHGLEGSLSSGFFADISGAVGSRYGIASANYGVGAANGSVVLSSRPGTPTAQEVFRQMSGSCGAQVLGGNFPTDPDCAGFYMTHSDAKPTFDRPTSVPTSGPGRDPVAPIPMPPTPPPPPPPPPPTE